MWNSKRSIILSTVVCWLLAAILVVLGVFAPSLFRHYMVTFRGFEAGSEALLQLNWVFVLCFYPAALFAGWILYSLLKLLGNLRLDQVFVSENVAHLKSVSWCCFAIGGITLTGSVFYLPFLFVAAAGGFVGILLRVLKNVMEHAVALRAENDLTI